MRIAAFVAVLVAIVTASGAYLYVVRSTASATESLGTDVADEPGMQAVNQLRQRPHVAFRNMVPGDDYGRLAFVSLEHRDRRLSTRLSCNRVHFTGTFGVCLTISRQPAGFRGYLIDRTLGMTGALELPGMPSRTRVSPDSRFAAYTVFVAGDSYLASGLSTRTRIVDARAGSVVGDLERFTVTRDGAIFQAVDFNFWGVTFSRDGNRFYATLGTGGRILLVEGHVSSRAMRVIGEDIECPSLSPDETRLAFKKKFGSGLEAWWQPAVMDLASREVRLLPEPQHIDDQIEWLDDGHVLYAVGHSTSAATRRADVWMIATDGSRSPTLFIADAESPAVVRH